MKFTDMVAYSLQNIGMRKLRSWLTIIGVIIGIATIVTLIGIGDGIKADIESQMEAFGSDVIIVYPIAMDEGFASSASSFGLGKTSGKLYESDIEYIKRVPAVDEVVRMNYGRAGLGFRDEEITGFVYGVDEGIFDVYSDYLEIENGRYYRDGEKKVVVLANDAANELFDDPLKVNSKLKIGNETYRVVGVLKKIGTSLSAQDDAAIYVPYEQGVELFSEQLAEDEVFGFMVTIREGFDADAAGGEIEQKLADAHRTSVEDADFSVITPTMLNQMVGEIIGLLTVFLFAISVVSAIVGGIGISNTMFMNVLERTREIGVLKSIGAKKNEILLLFLFESAIIGFAGGALGLALGVGVMALAGLFGVPYIITPYAVAFALLFATAVGAVAGLIPARNASVIPAVESLRY